jgi:hypothetical protein
VVASTVTMIGPSMKTASSATASSANAVCTSRSASSTCAHRARTELPIAGNPAPHTTARTYAVAIGQSASTAHISSDRPAPQIVTTSGSTRACPSRSRSRPWGIAKAACPISIAAETDPASP